GCGGRRRHRSRLPEHDRRRPGRHAARVTGRGRPARPHQPPPTALGGGRPVSAAYLAPHLTSTETTTTQGEPYGALRWLSELPWPCLPSGTAALSQGYGRPADRANTLRVGPSALLLSGLPCRSRRRCDRTPRPAHPIPLVVSLPLLPCPCSLRWEAADE